MADMKSHYGFLAIMDNAIQKIKATVDKSPLLHAAGVYLSKVVGPELGLGEHTPPHLVADAIAKVEKIPEQVKLFLVEHFGLKLKTEESSSGEVKK